MDTIAIYGSGNAEVICGNNAGLAFENVSHITITGVTFSSCGALRNSTSRNYSDGNLESTSTFKVALYFYLCNTVKLDTVVVANSPNATGVVMYDTIGNNYITNCKFYNNSVPGPSTTVAGGGGFYVEFTYCPPGEYCNNDLGTEQNSNSFYVFNSCTFRDNVAGHVNNQQSHSGLIVPYRGNHEAFGRGGGLSFFFNGNSSGNEVNIIDCNFTNNQALYGGGLFMEFHDNATGNTVAVIGCKLHYNSARLDGCSGGGIRIGHFVLSSNEIYYNNVTILNCYFGFNSGYYGGGLSIEPALQNTNQISSVAYFLIQECQFVQNNATALGSAVYVTLFSLITTGLPPIITFYHTLVQGNSLNTVDAFGAVHIHSVPVSFKSWIRFETNSGSALALVATHADFTSCSAQFTGNSGTKGGAIALLGAAWLLISSDTDMKFIKNTALTDGGAIYNMYIQKERFNTSTNCFLKYSDPTMNPENWTANFTFINNTDRYGQNSIHTTSLLPCGVLSSITSPSKIFCWNDKNWNYIGSSCGVEISTDASSITPTQTPTIYPGQITRLPLLVTDDLGHDVLNQTVFTGSVVNDTSIDLSLQFTYISSGYVQLSGNRSGNTSLLLDAAGSSQLHYSLTVMVTDCPPGFSLTTATCACDLQHNFGGIVLCLGPQGSGDTPPALLQQGYWLGHVNGSSLLAGLCPPGYCNGANSSLVLGTYIRLPSASSQLEEVICSGNRTGILCGDCKSGYSPAINIHSYQCLPCNHSGLVNYNVLMYVGAVYVPLVLFFIMIIICNIRLTAGAANVFILYSQLISSTFDLSLSHNLGSIIEDIHYNSLLKSYRFLYGIFNLDFLLTLMNPFCVSANMNELDVISLNYIVAFLPLVMIIIMLIIIKLLSFIRPSRCCSRCRMISISPMMAFASFLLLSYNKFTVTSTMILSEELLITSAGTYSHYRRAYSSGQYAMTDEKYINPYALMAYLFLFIPVLLPIVLLEYPVRFFERILNKIPFIQNHYSAVSVNIFLDTFQGNFKNKRRFFASFYFIFRLVIAIEYIVAVSDATQIILQQATCVIMIFIIAILKPYKHTFLNYLDILMFTNMAIIGSLSMFMLMNASSTHIVIPIAVQYVLIIIPAILYGSVFLVWVVAPSNMKALLLSRLYITRVETNNNKSAPRPESDDEEERLISRSREQNSYTQLYDSVSEKDSKSRIPESVKTLSLND